MGFLDSVKNFNLNSIDPVEMLNPGEIEAKPAQLDQGTQQAISNYANRVAGQTPESIAAEKGQGMGLATKSVAGVDGMSGALDSKYNSLARQQVRDVQAANKYGSYQDYAQRMNKASQFLDAKQKVVNSAYQRQMQAYNANLAARAQVMSSVFSTVGMIGGAAVGGAPGAMAGSQIGAQAGGNSAGPQKISQGNKFSGYAEA